MSVGKGQGRTDTAAKMGLRSSEEGPSPEKAPAADAPAPEPSPAGGGAEAGGDVNTLLAQGQAAYDAKDFDAAMGFFEAARTLEPDNRKTAFQIKRTQMKLKSSTKKAPAPAPAPEAPEPETEPEPGPEPETPSIEAEEAEEVGAVEEVGENEEADGETEVPADPLQLEEMGNEAFANEDFERALLYFDAAIEVDPNYERAWNNKGVVLMQMGEIMDAFQCYAKAIEINPKYADVWYNMGYAFQEQERYDDAIECYCNALEVDPDNEDAQELLAYCKELVGQ